MDGLGNECRPSPERRFLDNCPRSDYILRSAPGAPPKMILESARVENFKCIDDSTEFSVRSLTALVGKNESGKTALLKALYRINPILPVDGDFVETEYPRRRGAEYRSCRSGTEHRPRWGAADHQPRPASDPSAFRVRQPKAEPCWRPGYCRSTCCGWFFRRP